MSLGLSPKREASNKAGKADATDSLSVGSASSAMSYATAGGELTSRGPSAQHTFTSGSSSRLGMQQASAGVASRSRALALGDSPSAKPGRPTVAGVPSFASNQGESLLHRRAMQTAEQHRRHNFGPSSSSSSSTSGRK
jgi:hypothetical protein